MALPAGRYGVTKNQLLKIKKLPMNTIKSKADNSVIAPVENGTNPTKAYAVGEHMIRGGKFCTVTSPVTTSSTWTLGSNYVEGTIADLMAPLSDALTSSNGTIEANRICTCGNLVSYMIRFKATEDISAGTNIINGVKLSAVLNSGMATALFTDISTGNTYRVNLDVSANIPRLKTLDAIANGTTIRGSITYISQ